LFVLAGLAAFVTLATRPARAAAEGHFDRTLTVNGPVSLDVQTGSGNIDVRAGGSGKVEIHGTIRADEGWHILSGDVESRIHEIESNPPIEQDGNTIRIGRNERHDLFRHISISYEIVVPADTSVKSKSGSGNVQVEGTSDSVEAASGSGNVRLRHIGAEVRASSGSGDIEFDDIRGRAHASTGSGSIHATGVAGGLSGSTGSGDIVFEQTAAGDVDVSSGSGNIELKNVKGAARASTGSGNIEAQGEPMSPWRLHTGSGDVTVSFPASAAFDLSARSTSGRIDSRHEIALEGRITPSHLQGKVHGGGVLVDLDTSSGSITIN